MKQVRAALMMALFAAGAILALPPAARADGTFAEVKARMQQRLPQVNALKARGVAGENSAGLLTVLGKATQADQAVVAAENQDRRAVYAAIAVKTGATPESVGARRARRIAQSAPAGAKIQAADGKWTTKQ